MAKSFNQFDIVSLLRNIDYLVGYKGDNGEEIRISGIALANLFTGASGNSVQIQFSANTVSWHYPALENDKYVRFKVGDDAWSVAFKIEGKEGKGLNILGTYDNLEDLQQAVVNPTQGDMYNVGEEEPYHIYMYDNGIWKDQGRLKGEDGVDGINGTNGINGVDGKNIELQKTSTYIQWRLTGASTWTNLIALSDLKGEDGTTLPSAAEEGDILHANSAGLRWLKGRKTLFINRDAENTGIQINEYVKKTTVIITDYPNIDLPMYVTYNFSDMENMEIILLNTSDNNKKIS
ncbi:MAG: hypothetical protein LBE13_18715, partial [Bacteroidales bacterium]|nr:hypothetical protein [Bacteroidales bacterium]